MTHPVRLASAAAIVAFLAASVGAFPGVHNRTLIAQGVRVTDLAIVALIGALIAVNSAQRWRGFENTYARISAWCGAALLLWWLFVLNRTTSGIEAGPIFQSVRYGADFAYFALLLPLFVAAMSDAELRMYSAFALGVVAGFTAFFESLARLGVGTFGFIVHRSNSFASDGLERIYTDASDLVTASFFFALGTAVLSQRSKVRGASILIATLCLLDIALALGRAKYLGLIIGVVCASFVWWHQKESGLRLVMIFASLIAVVLSVTFLAPDSRPATAVSGVTQRLSSTFTDARSGASGTKNTIRYRQEVQAVMRQRLDRERAWIAGLGFRSPSFDYDPNLPDGEIRNADVGVYGALMTIGLIGTGLLLLPVALASLAFVRSRRSIRHTQEFVWGGLALCVYGVSTSISLGLFFSPTGLVVAAGALGLALAETPMHIAGRRAGSAGADATASCP